MCTIDGGAASSIVASRTEAGVPVLEFHSLLDHARFIRDQAERRRGGLIGYGSTKPGDRILYVVDTHYHPEVVKAFVEALRERQAKVDVIVLEAESDREFDYLDEIRVVMRREPWNRNPRRWEGVPWVEELAERQRYDLLIHGKGGRSPDTSYRYEQCPFLRPDMLASPSTTFPYDLHRLVNEKTWGLFWEKGPGGRVRITDPEGTDLSYMLDEDYFRTRRYLFSPNPIYSHLFLSPTPPLLPSFDATGVVAGTTSHFVRPFPRLQVAVEDGQVTRIEGGDRYGQAWRELAEEARTIHYPVYPRPGLFWLWETALGTNPKVQRQRNVRYLSSGGFEWERRRAGVIHFGFGTVWRGPEEEWAAERGLVYGHLHIHVLFPTVELTSKDGEVIRLVDRGHLTSLDDPDVRKLAAAYGDPDQLLREDWIPQIPGINAPGRYEEFAQDPAAWIYGIEGKEPNHG